MKIKINRLLLLSTVLLCFVGGTLAYQSPSPTPPKEKQVEYIEDGEDTNQDSHPSFSEKSSATSGSDNENALTQIRLYKNQLSQTLTKHVNWISSLLKPTQNEYIPQLHTAYTRWNGELQALIDGNYTAGTLSSYINTAKTFFIDGTAELEKIYDSACKADDDLSTENNKAYKDVVSYQEQLSSVAKKDSLCINRMQEPIKVVYIPQLSAVHAEYNSKINNVIDSYYHSATLSNHIEEAKHFFLDGSDELTSVYNDASKANEKVSDNDIVYYRVLSYKAKLSTKTSDYITTLTPRIEDYLQQIFFPYISERRDVWMNNLQKLIDDNYQSGTLAKMASKAEEFFLKGSDEITQIYNDACDSNVEDYTGSISVSFPDNVDMKPFGKMIIEMENLNTHQIVQYSISNKKTYTFTNIPRNTNWTVRVKNKYGDIFANINDVCVNKNNITASFSTLSKPQDVSLQLYDDNGKEISQPFLVTWYDEKGNLLQTGKTISGLSINKSIYYEIKLDADLIRKYKKVEPHQYVVKDGDNLIKCPLAPYTLLKIYGKVIDAETKLPVNAEITATQSYDNGIYSTKSMSTDKYGVFSEVVSNVFTVLSVKSSGSVPKDISCDTIPISENEISIGTIVLSPVKGKEVELNISYKKSIEDEDGLGTMSWYDDTNNLSFSVYNKTKKKDISNIIVEYPRIIFIEEIQDGDILEMTVSSKKGSFMPIKRSFVMSNETAITLDFPIVELGKVHAEYHSTENSNVVAILYDHDGDYIQAGDYYDKQVTFSNLNDGKYYLLSIGKSDYFNSPNNINKIYQIGLIQGKDYVLDNVQVLSGRISNINNESIPKLNEANLYYTDDFTSFGINKTNVTAGDYVTFQSTISFKDEFKNEVKNVELVVDIPEGTSFIENSVMEGSRTSSYSTNDNSLTIPLQNLSERIRACVITTQNGTSKLSAYVRFQYNGQTILQPIGDAAFETSGFAIYVPQVTTGDSINVSGTTIGKSDIKIYDNDVLIGRTTSRANGTWAITCGLNNPYNLSMHRIFAEATTTTGLELQSEAMECVYNTNAVEAKSVSMSFYNGWLNKNIEVNFDLQNKTIDASSYMFYNTTDVTFTADLTNNDPNIIRDVTIRVYTDKNNWRNLKAQYNTHTDNWFAVSQFSSNELPVGVDVLFSSQQEVVLDDKYLKDQYSWLDSLSKITAEIDTITVDNDEYADLSDEDFFNFLHNQNDSTLNIEEIDCSAKEYTVVAEDGRKITVSMTSCSGLVESSFANNEEYYNISKTSGGSLYVKRTENYADYVDFENNVRFTLLIDSKDNMIRASKAIDGNFIYKVSEYIVTFGDLINTIDDQTRFLRNALEKMSFGYNMDYSTAMKGYEKYKKIVKTLERRFLNPINSNWANIWAVELHGAYGMKDMYYSAAQKALKSVNTIKAVLGKFSLISSIDGFSNNAKKGYDAMVEWRDILRNLQDNECPGDEVLYAKAVSYTRRIFSFYYTAASSDLASLMSLKGKLAGTISLALCDFSLYSSGFGDWMHNQWTFEIKMQTQTLRCNDKCPRCDKNPCECNDRCPKCGGKPCVCKDKCPKCGKRPCVCRPPQPQITPIHDPSGYVYEGVPSNRLEGVTATCYYKEFTEDMYGDTHENIVLWDAKEYGQENPLKTDENGYYRWDVPQGLWQVKFEKEGYETVYSEWLPVPPPQLDVNIAMTQARQPEINRVHAYKNAVEITFDKFMQTESLVKDNIIIYDGDQAVKGNIVLLDEETNPTIANKTFASKLRYTCQKSFKNKEIKLLIKKNVKSYSSINMENDYECTIPVENEITEIKIDSVLSLAQGATMEVAVNVLPAKSSSGKKILISNYSSKIVGIQKDTIFVDDNGLASFNIRGEMLGNTALILTIDGYDLSTKVDVNVINESSVTDIVKASIESGATVEEGTKIYLSCNTPEAKIYYTIDGSCPCGSTALVYNGEPIIVNENMTIKAMAIAPGMYESEIVEYQYFVQTTEIESTVINDGVSVTPLTVKDKITIMSNDGSVISDVKVIDMSGKVVMESSKTGATVSLDMSRCSSGIHLLNFKTNGRNMSKKVVKID